MSRIDCNNYCNRVLKNQHEWLKEVDKFALSNSVFNMNSAYQNFFRLHRGYPKFKNKRDNKKSYITDFTKNNIEVDFENDKIKLPKLKWIKAKVNRVFTGKIKQAIVSQTPTGKFYVSIVVDIKQEALPKTDNVIGLDLGIKDLCITSNGKKYENPRIYAKYEKKLAREQRRLAKKQKGSHNREKQRIKVARVYEKITNIKNDYLHKVTKEIINENQVIISEDLQVLEMLQNHNLAKEIFNVSWYEFTRQLAYKAEWYGRTYTKIDRYFPSSQLCSCCGYRNSDTKDLSVRKWICPECGTNLDRDVNAAINILNEGLKQINLI